MDLNSRPQGEETKIPTGEQSASAGRPRTPVRLRPGAPTRTAVLLSPRTPSRTRLSQSEAPSKAPVLPKDVPSKTRVPLSESPSKSPVSPSEVLSRTPSAASFRTRGTLGSLSAASSRTPLPPSEAASSLTLVSLSETSSQTPGSPSEAPSGIQMPPKKTSSSPHVSWDQRGFSAVDASDEYSSQESGLPDPSEDSRVPPVSYFDLIRNYLKSERPMKAVKGLIDITMEVMKLDHQVKETEIQQKMVQKETEMLLNEKLPIQAETRVMLANLAYKTKEYGRDIENQWNSYAQESGETQQPGQELASHHTESAPELPTAQGAEQGKLEPLLKQQWQASKEMAMIREKQYKELQTLQEELKQARAQTAAKAHARYLWEKALLEKQLKDSTVLEEKKEKELKTKAQALEAAAERCAAELHRLLAEDLSLHPEFSQQPSGPPERKAPQSWLTIQKQQLK
uniref:Coiled-coil domain containing 121 n=1 Tax=Myotis myotis TaxID=51298 RepID=A0A7J7XE80_MYOMY|nr:coiled-coil domain containing 121 [Myotis myotis]